MVAGSIPAGRTKLYLMISSKYQKVFQYVAVSCLVLIVYLIFIFVYRALGLPNSEEIINFARRYYEEYGYWVVLVGALAEGILFVNWYLPGSVVVALGATLAKDSGLNIFLMLALVIIGFYATAILNYAMGYFGWYHAFIKLGLKEPLEKVQHKVENKGLKILFTTYVHPNFGALAATSAGILRMSFSKFSLYAFISIVLWNSLWTLIFYYFGSELLKHVNLVVAIGAVFVYFMFTKSFKEKETS